MNDKILIDRAVVVRALDALEEVQNHMNTSVWFDMRAAALRATLEQPEQCSDEDDCTHMPWCRIRNQCQKVALKNADAIDTTEKRVEKTVENEHDPKDVGDAPSNSLPTWYECELIIKNDEFCKRTKAGLESQVLDTPRTTPIPTALHRFIYEYDDADSYRSEWFMHRLEQVLKEAAAQLPAAPEQEPLSQDDVNWLKARPHIEQFIKEQDHDVTVTDRGVTFKSRGMWVDREFFARSAIGIKEEGEVHWTVKWGQENDRPFCMISKRLANGLSQLMATHYGPPRREWVGQLTDEELDDCDQRSHGNTDWTKKRAFARAIAEKLKEKNA